jgi:glucose/arabinose dehydrogenase
MNAPRATLLIALSLAACSTPSAQTTEPSDSATASLGAEPSASSTGPVASATATSAASAGTGPSDEQPPQLALERVAEGLASPIGLTGSPEGWLLVNEQEGRVVAVNPADGQRMTVLDITDRVSGGGERGLLGLALHPDWPDPARAFVHYTDRNGDTVLSEFAGTGGEGGAPPTFDQASEQVLLQEDQPYPNHNGGQLAFGPDGHLYMGLGDGGAADDPHGHGQNPETRLGSILRIDVSTTGSAGIPDDNPFASGEGGAPEVFLIGLRNPWRFSFDRVTGLLWIADVGQDAFEEVDRIDTAAQAGANLGWNVMEGAACFAIIDCSSDGYVLPIAEYGHDLGCSVTGGYVYRGEALAELRGWYVFGDVCSGRLFAVASDAESPPGSALQPTVVAEPALQVSSFGEAADGELYLVELSGGLYRVTTAP